MDEKNLIKILGFVSKENESGLYTKTYTNGYAIEIDCTAETINYGKGIKSESKTTTQNFSQAENFVVLECIDRLLEKGYKPKDIILEKTFPQAAAIPGGWIF